MSAQASSSNDGLSFAEQLRLKHSEPHAATVEDTVDEEDIQHPPPSAHHVSHDSMDGEGGVSEKALGKGKAEEVPRPSPQPLDTKSETAFPALGGGPKTKAANAAPTWGAMRPQSAVNSANGINGHGALPGHSTSGASTPISLPLARGGPGAPAQKQGVNIPGRHIETVHFKHAQLQKRQELRKPIPEIIRDINRRSKATVTMAQRPDGISFEGTGPVDAVRQALKDIAVQVGSKQSTKISIPASARAHIIGRQGAKIQEISRMSGARIQVPKAEDLPIADDDDSTLIDVSIEGDAVAAHMALQEIQRIVNSKSTGMNIRMRDVPAEFYPFLAGPHNTGLERLQNGRDVQVTIPHYYSWTHQPPPSTPSSAEVPQFEPHPSIHIQLAGERMAVMEAKAEIERQVEQLRREITLSQLPLPRGQHQFVAGQDGAALHELLGQTGCAVILPPDSDDSETVYITGPRSQISRGEEEVMNLASSMQMANVNITPNDIEHARALTRYLEQRRAIRQLEDMHDSRIVLPKASEGPVSWEVYSREGKNTIRARTDIMKIANAYPPSRFRRFPIDPFFHEHLRERHLDRLQQDHGVHMLFPPAADESPLLVLVYEGPKTTPSFEPSRAVPSSSDVANFERALQAAHAEIVAQLSGHADVASQNIEVPTKFHDKVRRFVRNDQQDLSADVPAIRLIPHSAAQRPQKTAPEILLRGPQDRLDLLSQKIREFVEAEKRDDLERGFTMSFEFPQKYANYLIGKRGENINKLREQFDVEIHVKDGQVELKGPKAKAEAAKIHIISMAKKLEDEATHVLKIKPQYHRELIGAKGAQVHRLQERYNVRVQFPRAAPAPGDMDSVIEGSDAGGPRASRQSQPQDEVVVRGPRKGADGARDELLSLLQYSIDNSHSATVSVAKKQVPQLIGQGGKEMEAIRHTTGAKIDIPNSDDAIDAAGRVELKVRGTKKQVDDAKRLLEQRAKAFDDTTVRNIEVDKKYHKALIGAGGANIRQIIVNAGGSDDRRELARTVRFPQADSEDLGIKVEGRRDVVEKICASIEQFAHGKANETSEIVEVAPSNHRLLIGPGGETKRALESKLNVRLDIPKQTVQGPARSQIKVYGPADKVAAAKAHIGEMMKGQEGETVQVPRSVYHTVSDNGTFFRKLRNDMSVTVDHAGQKPPQRPTTSSSARVNGGSSVPLITDEQPAADAFSWNVVSNANEGSGDMPWVLKGSPENVAKAKALILKSVDAANTQTATGYLILPDPKSHRSVIGQGGSTINAIRAETGCKINVPKSGAKSEAIEIIGSANGVERAKDMILEVVGSHSQ